MWETDFLCLSTCGITAICFSCNLTNNTKHEDCYNWYLNSPLDLVWLGKWHLGDVIGVGPNLKFTRLCRGWSKSYIAKGGSWGTIQAKRTMAFQSSYSILRFICNCVSIFITSIMMLSLYILISYKDLSRMMYSVWQY